MGNRILNESDLTFIREQADLYAKHFNEYATHAEKLVNQFNNDPAVQAFYASGNFGNKQREKLSEIVKAIRKYLNVVSEGPDSLVEQTKKYVDRQMELNHSGLSSGAKNSTVNNANGPKFINPSTNSTYYKN